jgi:ABC-type sugar transport system substrate-binding protein
MTPRSWGHCKVAVPALQTAGLGKQTKIVGVNATAAEVDSLAQGQTAGWVVTSVNDLTWITADWMAQLSLGEQISPANLAAGDRARPERLPAAVRGPMAGRLSAR